MLHKFIHVYVFLSGGLEVLSFERLRGFQALTSKYFPHILAFRRVGQIYLVAHDDFWNFDFIILLVDAVSPYLDALERFSLGEVEGYDHSLS